MKPAKEGYYLMPNIKLSNKYERWRKISEKIELSKKAKLRLEWLIYYETKANENASLTCRHFGITRSLWYNWKNRFDESNLMSLEDKSTSPINKRKKEYTPLQYERIVKLRKKYIRYGKTKLFHIYNNMYKDDHITQWKVQCIIEASGLYYNAKKVQRIAKKRSKSVKKKRISELKKKLKTGYLICVDTIVKHVNGKKRYVITAIDKYAKIAYVRMYKNHSSLSAQDFLYRLNYVLNENIEYIQTDNGSEFKKHFEKDCVKLKIPQYYSRVRNPKDNPDIERFNRTVQEEFIQLGNMSTDVNIFNRNITEWLIEYNFHRPHQTLEYMTPIAFTQKYGKVSNMYSSNTRC